MPIHADHPSVTIVDHPLIQDKLSHMRMKDQPSAGFRSLLKQIAMLMGFEIMRDLTLTHRPIDTPLEQMDAPVLSARQVALVSILRAGLGMVDGLRELIPSAREGHIGLYRDEDSKRPVEYLVRLPTADLRPFILVDPMLATGHSAVHAIDVLNRHGVSDDSIRFMALVAAPQGVATLTQAHPDVRIFVAAVDSQLDGNAFIRPGLGDAGDRLFGT